MTTKKQAQAAAAMVQSKIVKGGGAGLADPECAAIFAQFDPPIKPGTYDSVSKERRADVDAKGKKSRLRNSQSEHQIANSGFQGTRGDISTNVHPNASYSEGAAPAYSLYDDQTVGTEHKVMTDAARDFMQKNGNNATVGDYLDHMEKKTAEMLDDDSVKRAAGEKSGRSRIKNADKMTKAERKKLAEKAAACLKQHAERVYKELGIKRSDKLRNGFGSPPAAGAMTKAVKKAAK